MKGALSISENWPARTVTSYCSAPFSSSGYTSSLKLHDQRNVIAILKEFEELPYNQAFKLVNSVHEITGLAASCDSVLGLHLKRCFHKIYT